FFFQAEDGIRDFHVTGVQTCALPISEAAELQQASFRLHLEAARITGKPVIVHTRAAREDTLTLLREAALPQAGVLHCFTEDWDMARAALDLGFYISLSGLLTFRHADMLR